MYCIGMSHKCPAGSGYSLVFIRSGLGSGYGQRLWNCSYVYVKDFIMPCFHLLFII